MDMLANFWSGVDDGMVPEVLCDDAIDRGWWLSLWQFIARQKLYVTVSYESGPLSSLGPLHDDVHGAAIHCQSSWPAELAAGPNAIQHPPRCGSRRPAAPLPSRNGCM